MARVVGNSTKMLSLRSRIAANYLKEHLQSPMSLLIQITDHSKNFISEYKSLLKLNDFSIFCFSNRLLKEHVFKNEDHKLLNHLVSGNTAIVSTKSADFIRFKKVIDNTINSREKVLILAGILEERLLSQTGVEALAKMLEEQPFNTLCHQIHNNLNFTFRQIESHMLQLTTALDFCIQNNKTAKTN